ncbi:hypothetical protein RclHR1_16200003 [Rhizophagus clarus]|uniref:Tigger transposable element-derived protein 4-like n=1 Tax=Rhizophagus clarus TaxID=94130 RepID=A0A2Z6QH83_9GLOM|nr:hypothetical protein RclHR1_16200003 [Rhizophagus clarus]GES76160.1 tigger transposable element-derived protein 4-like [Rhizophagus clarus]
MPEITIKKAIKYAAKAWDLVQTETIINCWKKTDILSPDTDDDESIVLDLTEYDEVNKIQDLIDQLTPNVYKDPISAKEYIHYDKDETNHQMITDKEIIELMKEPEEELTIKESEITLISNYEALAALNQIITYTEQRSDIINFPNDQIQTVKKLRKLVERKEFNSKQQEIQLKNKKFVVKRIDFFSIIKLHKVYVVIN